jgi:hypothetical protein
MPMVRTILPPIEFCWWPNTCSTRDAAAVVLRGYELRTDVQVIPAGQRYYDKRGVEMWSTVTRLLNEMKERTA